MNRELTIRRPLPGDAGALADLSTQLGYPSTPADMERRLGLLDGDSLRCVFVADLGGVVVGWVDIFSRRMLLVDGMAEVNGLVVDEEHRGQGIGERLMEAAENWAISVGCSVMRVRSSISRESAHRFYTARLNYAVVKQQMVLGKTLAG